MTLESERARVVAQMFTTLCAISAPSAMPKVRDLLIEQAPDRESEIRAGYAIWQGTRQDSVEGLGAEVVRRYGDALERLADHDDGEATP